MATPRPVQQLSTPWGRYVQWSTYYEQSRDVYVIVGTPAYNGPTWQVAISADFLLQNLCPKADLLRRAVEAAEAGVAPVDFAQLLQHQAGMQQAQQQQLQNVFQQGFGGGQQQQGGFGQQQAAGFGGYNQLPNQAQIHQVVPKPPLWQKPERVEQEIIAYRAWYLDWQLIGWSGEGKEQLPIVRPVLHSTNQEFTWDGPVTHADHPPGGEANNHYGLYAVGVEERFEGNFATYVKSGSVWGEVALSGLVVEGERGYRAETVTIRRLWVGGSTRINFYIEPFSRLAQLLADRYQCDVAEHPVAPYIERARGFYAETLKGV